MYTNNVNRITGLSGIDTDTLVDQMMNAESAKYNKMQQSVQWKQWQQDAYRKASKMIQEFESKYFKGDKSTNFRYTEAFQNFKNSVKNADGTDSDAVTVESSSIKGNYELEIEQLAKASSITGSSSVTGSLLSKNSITDMIDKLQDGDKIKVELDGVVKTITIDDLDLVDDTAFIDNLNDKLKTAFGTEQDANGNTVQKVSVSDQGGKLSFDTSLGHSLKLTDATKRTEDVSKYVGFDSSLFQDGKVSADTNTSLRVQVGSDYYDVDISLKSGDDYKAVTSKIQKALKKAKSVDATGNPINGTNGSQTVKDISGSLSASLDKDTNTILFKNNNSSEDVSITFSAGDSVFSESGTTVLNHTGAFGDMGLTSGATNKLNLDSKLKNSLGITTAQSVTINGVDIDIDPEESMSSFINKVNKSDANVNLSYDKTTQKFKLESKEMGSTSQITVSDPDGFLLNSLKIDPNNTANVVQGQDSIFYVDGVKTTRTSNDVEIDGLKLTLNKTTATGSPIKIGSEYDTDSTFDKIKSFVDDYNTLIEALNLNINEKRTKSGKYDHYEPLTEAQKSELSDKEIEQWEEKAKTGLLYRDENISSFLSKMRTIMYKTVDVGGGRKLGLYELGITTSDDYKDNGKLVIDEKKLREAIKTDGDAIQTLFTKPNEGIADQLSKVIDDTTGIKGSLRIKAGIEGTASDIDNLISDELDDLSDRMKLEKQRLYDKEMKLYQMFASMESAVNKQNNQLQALQSMMG